jgi:hypothetical protein
LAAALIAVRWKFRQVNSARRTAYIRIRLSNLVSQFRENALLGAFFFLFFPFFFLGGGFAGAESKFVWYVQYSTLEVKEQKARTHRNDARHGADSVSCSEKQRKEKKEQ